MVWVRSVSGHPRLRLVDLLGPPSSHQNCPLGTFAAKNEKVAQRAFYVGAVGFFLVAIVPAMLGILASAIVMWFSRQREVRADAGAARLSGRDNMIAALERLKGGQPAELPEQFEAMGIAGRKEGGIKRFFMSHPPLDERIAALSNNLG